MNFLCRIAVLSVAVLSTEAALAGATDVCAMVKPPPGSKVRTTHAGKLLTYPQSLSSTYTGCRVTWLEDGQRLATVHVDAGRVRSVEVQEPDGETKRCAFDARGALTAGQAAECMPAENWVR